MIRLGLIGLGAAGQAFLPAIAVHEGVTLAAVCDARAEAPQGIAGLEGVPAFTHPGEMLAGVALDAVYVGTPTDLHAEHVMAALDAGCHVLCEKPMAPGVETCLELAARAEAAGLALIVGHSHSHDLPIRRMREIILSGDLGEPAILSNTCYSDWVYRPRRPEELRPELGGGVTFRQGAHQFDILCALACAPAVSLRATTYDIDPERPTIGAHNVTIRFANGATGTAIYNGYGLFDSSELTGGVAEWGTAKEPGAPGRPAQAASPEEELRRKQERARTAIADRAPHQPHFGLTLASCERGFLRQSPQGLMLHSKAGRQEIVLQLDRSPRMQVLDEFCDALVGRPVLHTGAHGAAVTEICEAVLRSSAENREIELLHQGPGNGD